MSHWRPLVETLHRIHSWNGTNAVIWFSSFSILHYLTIHMPRKLVFKAKYLAFPLKGPIPDLKMNQGHLNLEQFCCFPNSKLILKFPNALSMQLLYRREHKNIIFWTSRRNTATVMSKTPTTCHFKTDYKDLKSFTFEQMSVFTIKRRTTPILFHSFLPTSLSR